MQPKEDNHCSCPAGLTTSVSRRYHLSPAQWKEFPPRHHVCLFTRREEGPQDMVSYHGLSQHTLGIPWPATLSLCLQTHFSSVSPVCRIPIPSSQVDGWDFGWEGSRSSWIQQILFLLHPARAILCGAQLCSFHDSRHFKHYFKKIRIKLSQTSLIPQSCFFSFPSNFLSLNLRWCWSPLLQKYTKLLHNYFPNN